MEVWQIHALSRILVVKMNLRSIAVGRVCTTPMNDLLPSGRRYRLNPIIAIKMTGRAATIDPGTLALSFARVALTLK